MLKKHQTRKKEQINNIKGTKKGDLLSPAVCRWIVNACICFGLNKETSSDCTLKRNAHLHQLFPFPLSGTAELEQRVHISVIQAQWALHQQ